MGCCTSVPVPEQQGSPNSRPVQQTNQTNGASSQQQQNSSSTNAAARTVNVNSAKPATTTNNGNNTSTTTDASNQAHQHQNGAVAAAPADQTKQTSAPVRSELKGMQRYEVSPGVLGKGHFAVVKKCRDTVTGATYAVKIIDKKEMVKSSASAVKQEIEILRAVGAHPNIVQLIDHFEDSTRHYLVMELCMGGDLFSQIVENGKYSEQNAVRCCKQLANALKHIHSCGITHRDLKPENILLTSASPSSPLKLADFGLSKLIKGHLHPMRTVCGTWAYCVSGETKLKRVVEGGKFVPVLAKDVDMQTMLVDEMYQPVRVKAIHTTERSVEQLWSVHDQRGNLLMRCTSDHKLSMLQSNTFSATSSFASSTSHLQLQSHHAKRVEIRCADYFNLPQSEQARYRAYTASPSSTNTLSTSSIVNLTHISSSFPILVTPPISSAPLERFYGIEICSETHRYLLDSDLVTSNCAPEVIQRRPYDNTVDCWTLGVLQYILLSGYHPFDVYGECPEPELLQKIITCQYDFDDPVWVNISQSAKDLIKGLLVLDPTKRISLDYYLNSPWLNEGTQVSDVNNSLVVERLSKFSVGKTKFRALAATLIASNKFKASLSKSRASKLTQQAQERKTLTMPNGDIVPDYLGLGSERNGHGTTGSKRPFDGLESVREGKTKESTSSIIEKLNTPNSARNGNGNGHGAAAETSSSSGTSSAHTRTAIISVNQIDTTGASSNTNRSDRAPSIIGTTDDSHDGENSGPRIHETNSHKGGLINGTGSMESTQGEEEDDE